MANVTGRPLQKGSLARIKSGQIEAILYFQYNPSTIRRVVAADWELVSAPGTDAPVAVFGHARPQEINLALLLDAREDFDDAKEGIRAQLAFLESMVGPDPTAYIAAPSQFTAPAEYRLTIGQRTWPVICDSVQVEEKMWNRELSPVRAEAQLTLRTVHIDAGSVYTAMQALSSSRARVEVA